MKNRQMQLILNGKNLFVLNTKFISITAVHWPPHTFLQSSPLSHTATEIHSELRIMSLPYSCFKHDLLHKEINLFKAIGEKITFISELFEQISVTNKMQVLTYLSFSRDQHTVQKGCSTHRESRQWKWCNILNKKPALTLGFSHVFHIYWHHWVLITSGHPIYNLQS